jgi:hypothetical protein
MIEDIRNIKNMSAELLIRLYALSEKVKVQHEKELIHDYINEVRYYFKQFTEYETEKIIEFQKREREQ